MALAALAASPDAPTRRSYADAPVPLRRSYAERAGEIADLINTICHHRSDPEAFHEAKDSAARKARALQRALDSDGL